jgi:hypothetical protein
VGRGGVGAQTRPVSINLIRSGLGSVSTMAMRSCSHIIVICVHICARPPVSVTGIFHPLFYSILFVIDSRVNSHCHV